jgi:hypothetical protein
LLLGQRRELVQKLSIDSAYDALEVLLVVWVPGQGSGVSFAWRIGLIEKTTGNLRGVNFPA